MNKITMYLIPGRTVDGSYPLYIQVNDQDKEAFFAKYPDAKPLKIAR